MSAFYRDFPWFPWKHIPYYFYISVYHAYSSLYQDFSNIYPRHSLESSYQELTPFRDPREYTSYELDYVLPALRYQVIKIRITITQ